MRIKLAYGRGHVEAEFPDDRTTVIQPAHVPGLPDEKQAVRRALERPIGAAPLSEWIKPGCHVCIVFTDITRATPNDRLIPWLLEHLSNVPREHITLLNATGTHRPNTQEELERMLSPEIVRQYRVLNHDAEGKDDLIPLGTTRDGTPAWLNRHLVNADVRIITGFIEPHFFAGFSGGPKGIMPGVAGLQTIMSNHGSRNISDPQATFGITRGNRLWEDLRDIALRPGPSFLLNVALNESRQITGVFAGDLIAAHKAGCEFVRQSAMQEFAAPFDAVVTTNSGYPLDLNLYQGVKGISAGARVLKPGGALILACECSEGIPGGSSYERILHGGSSPEEILSRLAAQSGTLPEQWQAQIQALIQRRARIFLYSSLPDEAVKAAHLWPCHDIAQTLKELAKDGQIAVLPQGPLTIPFLAAPSRESEGSVRGSVRGATIQPI